VKNRAVPSATPSPKSEPFVSGVKVSQSGLG
jgi:hypothetical protein